MKITVEFECNNAAFESEEDFILEVSRLLKVAAGKAIEQYTAISDRASIKETSTKLLDINGTSVGTVSVSK